MQTAPRGGGVAWISSWAELGSAQTDWSSTLRRSRSPKCLSLVAMPTPWSGRQDPRSPTAVDDLAAVWCAAHVWSRRQLSLGVSAQRLDGSGRAGELAGKPTGPQAAPQRCKCRCGPRTREGSREGAARRELTRSSLPAWESIAGVARVEAGLATVSVADDDPDGEVRDEARRVLRGETIGPTGDVRTMFAREALTSRRLSPRTRAARRVAAGGGARSRPPRAGSARRASAGCARRGHSRS
jgi:hypothetical protein